MRALNFILSVILTTNLLYGQSFSDLKEFSLKGKVKTQIKNYYFSVDTSFRNLRILDSSKSSQTIFHYDNRGNVTDYEISEKFIIPSQKLIAKIAFKNFRKRKIVFTTIFDPREQKKNLIRADTVIWVTNYEYFENSLIDTLRKSRLLLDNRFRIIELQDFYKDTISNTTEIVTNKYSYNKNGLPEKITTNNSLKPLQSSTVTFRYLAFDKLGNPIKYLMTDNKNFIALFIQKFDYY